MERVGRGGSHPAKDRTGSASAVMAREKYMISVIVPVYNKKRYLGQCIDSILAQSYENLELLLVDDGSADGSGEICDRYSEKDGRVRVFHQENGGPTAAVVTGLHNAKGNYYVFVDSDDYISGDMLREMARQLTGRAGEIVCCNHVLEKQRETVPVKMPLAPGVYEGAGLEREIKANLLGREERLIPMSRCMKLCEKTVFEGNEKYYDTRLRMGDDFNLIYPALLSAQRIVVMDEAFFYHYRYVENSIVHAYDPDNARSVERWYRALYRIVRDRQVPDGEALLNREYCYMMLYVIKNELRSPQGGYVQRIRRIFGEPEVRERIAGTRISVHSAQNALLYLGIRHPSRTVLGLLRLVVRQYDRVSRARNRGDRKV